MEKSQELSQKSLKDLSADCMRISKEIDKLINNGADIINTKGELCNPKAYERTKQLLKELDLTSEEINIRMRRIINAQTSKDLPDKQAWQKQLCNLLRNGSSLTSKEVEECLKNGAAFNDEAAQERLYYLFSIGYDETEIGHCTKYGAKVNEEAKRIRMNYLIEEGYHPNDEIIKACIKDGYVFGKDEWHKRLNYLYKKGYCPASDVVIECIENGAVN